MSQEDLNMPPVNACSNEKHQCTSYAVPTMCRTIRTHWFWVSTFTRWFPCTVETPVQCFSNEDAERWCKLQARIFELLFGKISQKKDLVAKKSRYHTRRGKA